jgi:hypothetical protein
MEVYFHSKNSTHYSETQSAILQTHVTCLYSAMSHTNSHSCNQELSKHRCAPSLYVLWAQTHPCNREASKHTCFSHNFPILTQSSNQKESVAERTRTSTLGDFQTRTDYKSIIVCRQQSRDHRNVSMSIVACVTMLWIGPPFELLRC